MLSSQPALFEACVDCVASAIAAERGGAGRLELCEALVEGGITPSLGKIKAVVRSVRIPVHVIVRPRGGDFLYSAEEIEMMLEDIEACREAGAAGVVLGCLTAEGTVDEARCARLIACARGVTAQSSAPAPSTPAPTPPVTVFTGGPAPFLTYPLLAPAPNTPPPATPPAAAAPPADKSASSPVARVSLPAPSSAEKACTTPPPSSMPLKRRLAVTFHRAVDVAVNYSDAILAAIRLRCDYILTSGGEPTAMQGVQALRRAVYLCSQGQGSLSTSAAAAASGVHGGRCVVIAGGGVTAANAATIMRESGVTQLHGTARVVVEGGMQFRKGCPNTRAPPLAAGRAGGGGAGPAAAAEAGQGVVIYMGGERVNTPEAEFSHKRSTVESVGGIVRAMGLPVPPSPSTSPARAQLQPYIFK